ncbi:MAG: hypothetical protein KatS3mg085_251 [Candidatus Dojkabacteria bacterium]|nr:MAG: hypothetical protein KatS3mg085_251 [Candidatus Dojkabacteria bacterium]
MNELKENKKKGMSDSILDLDSVIVNIFDTLRYNLYSGSNA